jgi:hypothetical protein
MVEKWAYFFRETGNLKVVPEVLVEPPFRTALDIARLAAFTVDEWDGYINAGIAIQNERGALSFAEKRGRAEGRTEGRTEGLEAGLRQGIETVCELLGIELTDARRQEVARLNGDALVALLARIREQKRWD